MPVLGAAFWKGWDMTLVILAAMPVLIIVGAAIGTVSASLGKVASGAALHFCLANAIVFVPSRQFTAFAGCVGWHVLCYPCKMLVAA